LSEAAIIELARIAAHAADSLRIICLISKRFVKKAVILCFVSMDLPDASGLSGRETFLGTMPYPGMAPQRAW
jgi:hypothetical protein